MFLGQGVVFLVSQPRSGSTLLQRMLENHSQILSGAEAWIMLHPVYALREEGISTEYDHGGASGALVHFLEHHGRGRETFCAAVRAYAEVLYGAALEDKSGTFFLDKTPRYSRIIPDLIELFPKAKFLFLLRNPIAVLSSILRTWTLGKWENLYWSRYDLVEAPQDLVQGISLLETSCLVLRYEELVARPSDVLGAVCRYLDIDFEEEIVEYGRFPPPSGAVSSRGGEPGTAERMFAGDPTGVHEHDRPTAVGLDSWKSIGCDRQTRHFALSYLESLGQEVIAGLGYSYDLLRREILGAEDLGRPYVIVPWEAAIQPPRERSRRQRLAIERALAIQDRGVVKGTAAFLRHNTRSVVGAILGR